MIELRAASEEMNDVKLQDADCRDAIVPLCQSAIADRRSEICNYPSVLDRACSS